MDDQKIDSGKSEGSRLTTTLSLSFDVFDGPAFDDMIRFKLKPISE